MFTSFKATGGFASGLPLLKGRTFTFTPGLNIIFGANGTGKSTVTRIMAAYAGCEREGGWSRRMPVYRWVGAEGLDRKDWQEGDTNPFPEAFHDTHLVEEKANRAEVGWDGFPVFYTTADESDAPVIAFGMPSDGLVDEFEKVMTRNRQSSGENRLLRMSRLRAKLDKPPDLLEKRTKDFAAYNSYIRGLRKGVKKGRVTVILDEVDRSLDFVTQAVIFSKMLPNLAKDFQVIVVSHSPFIFATPPDTNIIGMEESSVQFARSLLSVATDAQKTMDTAETILMVQSVTKNPGKR